MPRPRTWFLFIVLRARGARDTPPAQGRTDVVTLANGDRITGEVVRLDRGRLEFKTDDAGTLYLEWDKLAERRGGTAGRGGDDATAGDSWAASGRAPNRSIAVVEPAGVVSLQMPEVTIIRTIGGSFWSKLDGSIDAGYNYTQSSGVAQLNVNSDTVFRRPASQARLTASLTMTRNDEDEEDGRDDRGSLEASYLRYPWQEVFIIGVGRFETNESLGLDAAVSGRRRGRTAPRQQQPGTVDARRGAGAQRRTGSGCRADAERRGADRVQELVLHLRSAEDELRPLASSTIRASATRAGSAFSSTPASSANSSRTCSSRSICTTPTTIVLRTRRPTPTTSASSYRSAGATDQGQRR